MKKSLLTIFCLLFCFDLYCQSLSLKDILFLTQRESAKSLLVPKGFTFSDYGHGLEIFFKNKDSATEEKADFHVYKNAGSVSYTTLDTSYMNTIVKSLYKQYKLILKDVSDRETFYQFGDVNINIMVDIIKTPAAKGRISMSKR